MKHQPSARVQTVLEDWRAEIESNDLRLPRHFNRSIARGVPRKLRPLAECVGLPVLGLGSCRIVFALGKKSALKVAYSQVGMAVNLLEHLISQVLDKNTHAAVRGMETLGLWLLQERVESVRYLGSRMMAELLHEMGVGSEYVCWDLHSANFGRRVNGDLVLVDLEALTSRNSRISTPALVGPRFAEL